MKPLACFDIDGTIFRSSLLIELVEQLIKEGVFPREATAQFDEALNKKKALQESIDCMGIETNPQPVKYAVSLLNRCKNNFRLPLVSPSEKSRKIIEDAIAKVNVCV